MSDRPNETAYRGAADQSTANAYNADQFSIDQLKGQVSTATLVKVTKVSNTPGELKKVGTLSAQPLVNQVDGYGNATPHGVVHNLSYFRYGGGKNAIIIDPEVGDIGVAVFCDRDISSVKANQGAANPGSRRRHDMADGIFFGIPVSAKGKETPEQYVRFTADGIEMKDKNGHKIEFKSDGVHING